MLVKILPPNPNLKSSMPCLPEEVQSSEPPALHSLKFSLPLRHQVNLIEALIINREDG